MIVDLVLRHLEEIGILKNEVKDGEEVCILTEYFRGLVSKALENPSMQNAPDPILSAIILSYLYCVQDTKYAYEIHSVASVIYQFYKQEKENEAHQN
jgi:hypothetical protein